MSPHLRVLHISGERETFHLCNHSVSIRALITKEGYCDDGPSMIKGLHMDIHSFDKDHRPRHMHCFLALNSRHRSK